MDARTIRPHRDLRSAGRGSDKCVLVEHSQGGQSPRSNAARLHGGGNEKDSGEGRLRPKKRPPAQVPCFRNRSFEQLHATHSIGRGRFTRRSIGLLPNRLSRHGVGGDRRGDGDRHPLDAGRDLPFRLPGFPRAHPAEILSGDGNRLRALFCSHGFGDHFPCLARSAAHDLAPAGLAKCCGRCFSLARLCSACWRSRSCRSSIFPPLCGWRLFLSPRFRSSFFAFHAVPSPGCSRQRALSDHDPASARCRFITHNPVLLGAGRSFVLADFCPLPPPRQTLPMAV
jgi:hypothetical protein